MPTMPKAAVDCAVALALAIVGGFGIIGVLKVFSL